MGSLEAFSPDCPLSHDVLLVCIPTDPKLEWAAEVEARYPGFKVRWIEQELYGGNGCVFTEGYLDLPPEHFDGVTMVMSYLPPRPENMKGVRFVQLTSAGADRWTSHDKYKDPEVSFCTANGIHSTQISEWVIGMWLMAQHHFLRAHKFMREHRWAKGSEFQPTQDSPGLRMGILGYGAIGRQCARVASAMGMEIYAYTRTERRTPEQRRDDSYCIPGTGDPDGILPARWFHGKSTGDLNEFLASDLDILVICTPLTDATRQLLSYEQFNVLAESRDSNYFYRINKKSHTLANGTGVGCKDGSINRNPHGCLGSDLDEVMGEDTYDDSNLVTNPFANGHHINRPLVGHMPSPPYDSDDGMRTPVSTMSNGSYTDDQGNDYLSSGGSHSHRPANGQLSSNACVKGVKRGTFLCNISRGPVIDTAALLDALETGKIRGAALDVTDPEPLPADHPLWDHPDVFITPHISWITPCYWDRLLRVMEENLSRMCQEKPLLNLMNRNEQY
ncbi:uncharacterized protein PpBr36_06599 [Pyricularia pennisetigena]|uniref:uncharacterized protein n=1 Tax=Pyricularia pennisetigena TaxID=1578925 RepID=UPI00114F2CDD|nr:uncharacterized protein PpBr36_06599 [Pyricularia pennisetigena]TLS22936.1 hypothetical protein PpBr36_06599 [Pyricularia pennisetigena]